MTKQIPFRILAAEEIRARPPSRRHSWSDIVAVLDAGEHVFVEDTHVNGNAIKYLRLVFIRRKSIIRLRTARVGTGHELWLSDGREE